MQSLLNRALYEALRAMYGDVSVTRKGDRGHFVKRVTRKTVGGELKEYVNYVVNPGGSYGEQYTLNCPWCGDTRKRLNVGYLFGLKDPDTHQINYGNIYCYNEACHEDFENRLELYQDSRIAGYSYFYGDRQSGDGEIEIVADESIGLTDRGEIGMPGKMLRFSEIPISSPLYQACVYMRDVRGFDLDMLENYYGVRVVERPHRLKILAGRVWAPFYRNQRLVAWTARAVPGLCDTEVPHFHSPGGLGGLLYGLAGALQSRVLCLVEGCADRWAVGTPGVAILSKKLGAQKCARLFADIHSSSVELIVVLLDPDQPESEAAKGKLHPILETVEVIKRYWSGPVLPVFLPSGSDPGGCSYDFLSNFLYQELIKHGYSELGQVLARDVYSSSANRVGPTRAGGKPQYVHRGAAEAPTILSPGTVNPADREPGR